PSSSRRINGHPRWTFSGGRCRMDDVEVLRALLDEYSPSGREGAAVHLFLELARCLGLDGHSDAVGNAIAHIGRGPPTILFLGHIDTVDGALPVRIEDGRLYGRGACDAKGPLAAALIAASRHRGRGEIIVIGAVGEELDSRGTRALLTYHPAPDFLPTTSWRCWGARETFGGTCSTGPKPSRSIRKTRSSRRSVRVSAS